MTRKLKHRLVIEITFAEPVTERQAQSRMQEFLRFELSKQRAGYSGNFFPYKALVKSFWRVMQAENKAEKK